MFSPFHTVKTDKTCFTETQQPTWHRLVW